MTVDGCPFDLSGAECFVVLCVCAPRNAREYLYFRFAKGKTSKPAVSAPRNAPEDLYFRFVEEYQAKLVLFVLRNARQPAYIRFVEKVTVKRTKSAHFVLSTGILPFKSTNTGVSVLSEFAPPERTCSFALS